MVFTRQSKKGELGHNNTIQYSTIQYNTVATLHSSSSSSGQEKFQDPPAVTWLNASTANNTAATSS